MNIKLKAISVMVALGLSGTVSAELVELDYKNTGDGLITVDVSTGLEWLDLNVTELAAPGDYKESGYDGFRMATYAEVDNLLSTYMGYTKETHSSQDDHYKKFGIDTDDSSFTFLQTFGITNYGFGTEDNYHYYADGYHLGKDGEFAWTTMNNFNLSASFPSSSYLMRNTGYPMNAYDNRGIFLVRDTTYTAPTELPPETDEEEEPIVTSQNVADVNSPLALGGLAMLGALAFRRKMK